MWKRLHTGVYQAAADVLGYIKKQNADWFRDNDQEIELAIEERNNALKNKLNNPSPENVRKLKDARAKLLRDLRRMEYEWWLSKAEDIRYKLMKTTLQAFSDPSRKSTDRRPK